MMNEKALADRIKGLRKINGFSQEDLAEKTGLSLRTIQRIENGETEPRGDSLKRISSAFGASPDEINIWQTKKDNNLLILLNLSQLGFIIFPLFGIIIPFLIWIVKKEKVNDVNRLGISIMNFQISWTIILFVIYLGTFLRFILPVRLPVSFFGVIGIMVLYLINLIMVISKTLKQQQGVSVEYSPSFKFLR